MSSFLLISLSISSSLDNFAVGLSLGLVSKRNGSCYHGMPHTFNLIIAVCNALGALASTYVGLKFGHMAPMIASWIASFAFLYLGFKEVHDWYNMEEEGINNTRDAASTNAQSAWKLATPMTLNNIAGGVAGGLAGTDPLIMLMMAFLASYGLMYFGCLLGSAYASFNSNSCGSSKSGLGIDPRLASSCIFIALGIFQLI